MRWLLLILAAFAGNGCLLLTQIAPSVLAGHPMIRQTDPYIDQAAVAGCAWGVTYCLYEIARGYRRSRRYQRRIRQRKERSFVRSAPY